MTNIAQLMEQLTHLEGVEVYIGQGPKHLENPRSDLTSITASYLRRFPLLTQDEGYVAFIEYYSGLFLYRKSPNMSVAVFGFSEASLTLDEVNGEFLADGESNIVQNGFLVFCDADLSTGAAAFAFDITGQRQWGIYHLQDALKTPTEWTWYCKTFIEWLSLLLESKDFHA